jgi:DNA-binding response OmpR family regulator
MVLVVDDDQAEAETLVEFLGARGFSATYAGSSMEARAAFAAVRVDALVGHLALRDGSLFDLVASLPTRPAIVVGYADVEIEPPPELDAICVRPLDLPVLGAYLHSRLGRRHSGEVARVDPRDARSVTRTSIPPAKRRRSR